MTYQSSLPNAGFRELNPAELEAISGGTHEIVVTGNRGGNTVSGSMGGFGFGFGFGAGGGGTSHDSGGAYGDSYWSEDDGLVYDENGNLEAIIVQAKNAHEVFCINYGWYGGVLGACSSIGGQEGAARIGIGPAGPSVDYDPGYTGSGWTFGPSGIIYNIDRQDIADASNNVENTINSGTREFSDGLYRQFELYRFYELP